MALVPIRSRTQLRLSTPGTKFAVTIPGDTAGTWVLQGNGVGAGVHFDLGSGATWRAPAGAWASGNYIRCERRDQPRHNC